MNFPRYHVALVRPYPADDKRNMMNFSKSNFLREKAKQLIPGGCHTYSKGDDQFPQLSPGFISKGQGAKVWDVDGNEFLDWGMGLRSVCLGHAYKDVLAEVAMQLELGVNFTRPSDIEVELAEKLCGIIDSIEMVKFTKNGSDATTAAVRLARAYTGKSLVLRCVNQPFFSVDDWFIGNTVMSSGVPEETKKLTYNFPFNDETALESLLVSLHGNVACIILEVVATERPKKSFLSKVRELCNKNNIVLIVDEIISGFRFDLKGAQHKYGITPDLTTFGKAMANGFSVAALGGKREIMKLGGLDHKQERVFLLSSTNGAETHCLRAALKTIDILEKTDFIDENWSIGRRLKKGSNEIARGFGIEKYAFMGGLCISPTINFLDKSGQADAGLRTLFLQETIKKGILIPYVSISASHREQELEKTIDAFQHALKIISDAISVGDLSHFLIGSHVKPVFRKFN